LKKGFANIQRLCPFQALVMSGSYGNSIASLMESVYVEEGNGVETIYRILSDRSY